MTTEQQVEALAHGLMDLDAYHYPGSNLGDTLVRTECVDHYRDKAARFLLPRLWEAETT